ncbi:MAG: LytTR family transcriptional regulator DNA-binding domain-containing protein [Reichenbachiella sp.]|uniref:LytR/AlgR family response regulator transcription factor n=1 Tax=Reichenbachiella sp. TaxID=2184521 RepID=UPI0032664425
MNKVSILIVEDETLLAQDIAIRLSKHYEIKGIADSVVAAMKYLEAQDKPDVVMLDIVLKGKQDGIDLAEIINERFQIPFIFLTSHADLSLVERAKKVRPHAYILKPFNEREIFIAIELALSNYTNQLTQEDGQIHVDFKQTENQVMNIRDSLFLKKDSSFQRVKLDEISLLEADNNYTTVYTKSNSYIYSTVLKKMEEKLPDERFMRVHRSFVINIDAVDGFEGNTLFVDNRKIPVSKQYRTKVFNIFRSF